MNSMAESLDDRTQIENCIDAAQQVTRRNVAFELERLEELLWLLLASNYRAALRIDRNATSEPRTQRQFNRSFSTVSLNFASG